MSTIPPLFEKWFAGRGWQVRAYQQRMVEAFVQRESTLLIAPTGGGKTLAGLLPSLIDLQANPQKGIHTLYISPLKALTNDIHRNLLQPIEEMGLEISVETRTGDTPQSKRQRQRKNPPNIFLTTPESLMLMLSYVDAPQIFGSLKAVVVDEVHSFASNKRGDFTTLALARLEGLTKGFVRFGLSATVADPPALAAWLGASRKPLKLLEVDAPVAPDIKILQSDKRLPYGGYLAKYAIEDIYAAIKDAGRSIVFVNTRAQAELTFQFLWDANSDGLPIAIYHGSLNKEQRRKTEELMAAGKLRAIVATSALELGIDWGDVDLVVQVGAPKGVSRLLQRIGRSNHRLDEPSRALLVPSNRFETLECEAAIAAIKAGQLDGEPLLPGALDILPQYIMNCACSAPVKPDALFTEIRRAKPYAKLTREEFDALFAFTQHGGYALQEYDRFKRLVPNEKGRFETAGKMAVARHRQNIGTIVEAGRLKVKRLYKAHRGKILGEVEEYFAQQLTPGDTFLFAGQVLAFEAVEEMTLEAWPAKAGERPKVPAYAGGQMPLSTFLADGVRGLIDQPLAWGVFSDEIREWLGLQGEFSVLPERNHLLVEQFPHHKLIFTMFYTFEGRKANQTLGMLLTRRMERMRLRPLSFSVTDYALSICSLRPFTQDELSELFQPDILGDELEEWIMDSPMLRRSFRRVAAISGLTEQNNYGARKSLKQVTFSTDLIYDVLRRHDSGHVLLKVTRQDAERELLDIGRLSAMLNRFHKQLLFKPLPSVSPLAIPIVLDVRRERIEGEGADALLEEYSAQEEAKRIMQDIKDSLSKTDAA